MFPPIATILPLFVIFRLDEKELGEAEVKGGEPASHKSHRAGRAVGLAKADPIRSAFGCGAGFLNLSWM